MPASCWTVQALSLIHILRKDLEQEFRTKEMLTSMGIYALLVLVVYGAALAQTTSTLDVLQMSGGLLWALIVFTSLLGLNRSFAHEKEQGCLEGILLVPLDRSVIFLAKATSNLLFLLAVEVVAVPLFYFFFLTTVTPGESFWLLAVPLFVGTCLLYTSHAPFRFRVQPLLLLFSLKGSLCRTSKFCGAQWP